TGIPIPEFERLFKAAGDDALTVRAHSNGVRRVCDRVTLERNDFLALASVPLFDGEVGPAGVPAGVIVPAIGTGRQGADPDISLEVKELLSGFGVAYADDSVLTGPKDAFAVGGQCQGVDAPRVQCRQDLRLAAYVPNFHDVFQPFEHVAREALTVGAHGQT